MTYISRSLASLRMRKLLLFLPALALSCSVQLAHAYDFGAETGRLAAEEFNQAVLNARKFAEIKDWEMFCKSIFRAEQQITTWFAEIQKHDPEMDVFKARQQSKESADSCRKTGYY